MIIIHIISIAIFVDLLLYNIFKVDFFYKNASSAFGTCDILHANLNLLTAAEL